MSTIKVNTIETVTGVEQYLAKAWVNFNGTGTVAIRQSGNVSSITDNGNGLFTVNFASSIADADYSVNAGAIRQAGANFGAFVRIPLSATYTSNAVQIGTTRAWNDSGSNQDCEISALSISR